MVILVIDTAISQQLRRNRKNLTTAWIDYKKTYDSVPHTWLSKVLELYKIDMTCSGILCLSG